MLKYCIRWSMAIGCHVLPAVLRHCMKSCWIAGPRTRWKGRRLRHCSGSWKSSSWCLQVNTLMQRLPYARWPPPFFPWFLPDHGYSLACATGWCLCACDIDVLCLNAYTGPVGFCCDDYHRRQLLLCIKWGSRSTDRKGDSPRSGVLVLEHFRLSLPVFLLLIYYEYGN